MSQSLMAMIIFNFSSSYIFPHSFPLSHVLAVSVSPSVVPCSSVYALDGSTRSLFYYYYYYYYSQQLHNYYDKNVFLCNPHSYMLRVDSGSTVVKALVRSQLVSLEFFIDIKSLGSPQRLTEMSTRSIFWG